MLSNLNIEAGNSRINVGSLLEASKRQEDPNFIADKNNFVQGKNKEPIIKEVFGQTVAQTKSGVWIPLNITNK